MLISPTIPSISSCFHHTFKKFLITRRTASEPFLSSLASGLCTRTELFLLFETFIAARTVNKIRTDCIQIVPMALKFFVSFRIESLLHVNKGITRVPHLLSQQRNRCSHTNNKLYKKHKGNSSHFCIHEIRIYCPAATLKMVCIRVTHC